jgi:hypothetical protein
MECHRVSQNCPFICVIADPVALQHVYRHVGRPSDSLERFPGRKMPAQEATKHGNFASIFARLGGGVKNPAGTWT